MSLTGFDEATGSGGTGGVQHRSFRLTRPAPAAAQQVRTAIVLPDREARMLLTAAGEQDVSRGGRFSAGPAGVQWWSGPWDGMLGTRGSAEHLGSVDWSYDTPSRHYVQLYRVLVTAKGEAAGQDARAVLEAVLALTGTPVPTDALSLVSAPGQVPSHTATSRDPFRASQLAVPRQAQPD